jgi:hypothetical protein
MAVGSTQPLTEMGPGIFLGVKSGRRVELTTLPPSVSRMSENLVASTSLNPKGRHGLYRGNFTFTLHTNILFNVRLSSVKLTDFSYLDLQ